MLPETAWGPTWSFDGVCSTSELAPKAEVDPPTCHVRKVPGTDSCTAAKSSNAKAAGPLEREPRAEDFDRIEGEFRIEAALNVASLAEAMLLAREQEIADRIAFAPQCLNYTFCLI